MEVVAAAAIGAGVSAATGGDPLKGALIGGATAGIGQLGSAGTSGSGGGMFDSMGDMVGDVTVSGATTNASSSGGLFSGLMDGFGSFGSFGGGGFGANVLTGLQVVGAVDSVVSPFMQGQRAADIAEINSAQTDLDIQQKLLQGRESSVRALETLNQQSAHNIAAGFASGIGLSPSVASSIDSITRKHRFDDTLTRTSNILQAGALQRKGELQRAQGQTAKVRGTFESLGAVAPAVKTIKTLFT